MYDFDATIEAAVKEALVLNYGYSFKQALYFWNKNGEQILKEVTIKTSSILERYISNEVR